MTCIPPTPSILLRFYSCSPLYPSRGLVQYFFVYENDVRAPEFMCASNARKKFYLLRMLPSIFRVYLKLFSRKRQRECFNKQCHSPLQSNTENIIHTSSALALKITTCICSFEIILFPFLCPSLLFAIVLLSYSFDSLDDSS